MVWAEEIFKQNVESVNWIILAAQDKEKKDALKGNFQAKFINNIKKLEICWV